MHDKIRLVFKKQERTLWKR